LAGTHPKSLASLWTEPLATSLNALTNLAAGAEADRGALRRFVVWAVRELGGLAKPNADQVEVYLPPLVDIRRSGALDERPHWLRSAAPVPLLVSLDTDLDGAAEPTVVGDESISGDLPISPRSPHIEWLIDRLHALGPAIHSAPARQPASAGEIAERLLPAYRIDGGRIRLSGCSLEDRAFFRIFARSPAGARPQRFVEWTIDADGRHVDDRVAAPLGLNDIGPMTGRPPELVPAAITDLTHLAEHGASSENGSLETIAATLLWCKWASGRLRIEFPRACAEIRFSGWASTLEAPAFICPETGRATHSIGMTDDGRIAAGEEIAVCQETNRRLLRRELAQCSASGLLALAELVETCPITERSVLKRLLATCGVCGEQVSPAAIHEAQCQACRSLAVAAVSDPRIARVLSEFPALDGWRKWRIAETANRYVLVGSSLLKRLLVVLDRATLEPRRVATGGRLNRTWTMLPPEQWALELGRQETA
jgi:hypothetical protein